MRQRCTGDPNFNVRLFDVENSPAQMIYTEMRSDNDSLYMTMLPIEYHNVYKVTFDQSKIKLVESIQLILTHK